MKQRILTGLRCKGNQLVLAWVIGSMVLTAFMAERAFGTEEKTSGGIPYLHSHTYDQMGENAAP